MVSPEVLVSYALTKAAFRVDAGGSANKLTLLALSWLAGGDQRCAVSHAVLAHWTGLSDRTVSKAIQALEKAQLIASRPKGRGRLYTVHVPLLSDYPDCDSHGQAECSYCGGTGLAMEMDHVTPRSQGGSDDPENLVIACIGCNSDKGSQTVEEWAR